MKNPNEINRGDFTKKNHLTTAAIALLTSGLSLGNEGSSVVTPSATGGAQSSLSLCNGRCFELKNDSPRTLYKKTSDAEEVNECRLAGSYMIGAGPWCRPDSGNAD